MCARICTFWRAGVTLTSDGGKPPTYVGHGVVFIQVLEGEAIYRYGKTRMTLGAGDTISVDAELNHGFVDILTDEFVFLSVQGRKALNRWPPQSSLI